MDATGHMNMDSIGRQTVAAAYPWDDLLQTFTMNTNPTYGGRLFASLVVKA